MRVAYLITTCGQWAHLERLIVALDDPAVGFYIHIDAKSAVPEGLEERLLARGNVVFAPRRKVWWGGRSIAAAILSLMELAAEDDWDYCVVMSGADYPVRSNRAIFEMLERGGEFINAAPGFRADKPESRVRYYWFDGFDRRSKTPKALLLRGFEMLLRVLGIRKRHYPFPEVYAGIVWSALSGASVRYIVDYVRAHPEYVRFFRTALVPDEMLFQTIVGNSPFAPDIRGTVTFMDWDHPFASPPLITAEHLAQLAPGGEKHPDFISGRRDWLFARKFDDRSGPVLDIIDAELRK
jgi:hypothetical protein